MPRTLPRLALLITCAVALAAGLACRDDDDAASGTSTAVVTTPAATREPASSPTVASTAAATATRAPRPGLTPEVDAIVDLVLARDTDGLARRVRLTALPCGPQQGSGSPPACPPGQPAGTPVEVLPVATCEGELRPASSVRPTLEDVTNATPMLFGVYRAPDPYLPHVKGEYVAVFSRQMGGQTLGAGLVIAGADVVGLWFGCGVPPTMIVPAGTPAVLLPGG